MIGLTNVLNPDCGSLKRDPFTAFLDQILTVKSHRVFSEKSQIFGIFVKGDTTIGFCKVRVSLQLYDCTQCLSFDTLVVKDEFKDMIPELFSKILIQL